MTKAPTIAAMALLGALLLASTGVARAAAPPKRQVPSGFMGVVADGPLLDGSVSIASQTPTMSRIGLETLGVSFNWSDAQPFASESDVPGGARSAYPPQGGVPTSLAATDAEVLAAAKAGMGVFPVVIRAPAWARLDPSQEYSPPADPATYANFMRLLVARYGPAGSFWAAHREVRAHPIRAWQIWNEPAGGLKPDAPSIFWGAPQPFQTRYLALLQTAHDAIKAADAGAQVVLAALVGRSWETLQTIYDAGMSPYFDAVSLHPYTGIASNVIIIPRRVRAVMQRNGDGAKPILISELGWPSFDGTSVARLSERQREQAQAAWLTGALNSLLGTRKLLGIRQILVYSWLTRDASKSYAFDYAGLERLLPNRRVVAKSALTVVARTARRIEGRCGAGGRGRPRTAC